MNHTMQELREQGWRGLSFNEERGTLSFAFRLDREWQPMTLDEFRSFLRSHGMSDRPEFEEELGLFFFELPEELGRELLN